MFFFFLFFFNHLWSTRAIRIAELLNDFPLGWAKYYHAHIQTRAHASLFADWKWIGLETMPRSMHSLLDILLIQHSIATNNALKKIGE